MSQTPAGLPVRFAVGITGHRGDNPALAADGTHIAAALADIFAEIEAGLAAERTATPALRIQPTRLHTLLAHGVDQLAASAASALNWQIVAPLPFSQALNVAVNAQPRTHADGMTLLAGGDAFDPAVQARAQGIRHWSARARLFQLADRDDEIAALFEAALASPEDVLRARNFHAAAGAQAALAGRVMVEQSDLLIGVWDNASRDGVGGTGHTIVQALEIGTPVLLLDPARPEHWSILSSTESLAGWQSRTGQDRERLHAVVGSALHARDGNIARALREEAWHARSTRASTLYRRIEALFGGEPKPLRSLVTHYEPPEHIAGGSAAPLVAAAVALPGADREFVAAVTDDILPAFARADGISSRLSDSYRSGMVANFILSALAVIVGVAWMPLGVDNGKWLFALGEFGLLAAILVITWLGSRRRLHARWFETRRVAEYLRHAPILLLVGVARPPSHWPRATGTAWPEYAARHKLRAPGLPEMAVTRSFLRCALEGLLAPHVASQRTYHHAKAKRLNAISHRLDRLATTLFKIAVASVLVWLLMRVGAVLHWLPYEWPHATSKAFAFLGIALPTLGASIAGIRYFGDFERFAAISEVTADKLEQVETRIAQLLAGPDAAIDYEGVSRLAHGIDDIVVGEIESWQAVFSGKPIALPA
ncbi:hypothetical protein MNR01_13145 [Lysobacter sp. S4-A87]|uniref:hypothetical protein n=1 Tax=Lysobacter sp. S4-A87 TaxID=2925843 RepID=UPI001F52B921|nr:hypothetical protein [Lysobacter sp. S4-A87]UNK48683.1 hypothetical protein MNR01_13145 [Lysobacter sp. S4-A87]